MRDSPGGMAMTRRRRWLLTGLRKRRYDLAIKQFRQAGATKVLALMP